MPSLSQLLTSHQSLLVLDAASTRVQVGLLRSNGTGLWRSFDEEAGNAIFAATDELLRETNLSVDQIGAFAFCEGPGSMLGTRTIAMALRTWQLLRSRPVYSYQSLELAGRLAWLAAPRELCVIADARRETWHVQGMAQNGTPLPLRRLATGELPAGELIMPEAFRVWTQLARPVSTCSYKLNEAFAALATAELFHAAPTPNAFQHEAPEYKKWSAQVHSAESAPPR